MGKFDKWLGSMRWYCLQTLPHKAFFARMNVRMLGFDTLLPTETRLRMYRGGVRQERLVPVFGSYLFARFDVDDPYWRKLYSAYGVRRIFGATPLLPTPLPEFSVERLRQCILPAAPSAAGDIVHPGTRYRVVKGPLANASEPLVGLCQTTKKQRAALMFDMLHGVTIEFDVDALVPAD